MSLITKEFEFTGRIWLWEGGKAAWHFVSLPKKNSSIIKTNYPFGGRGFGSVPVTVICNEFEWKTSIFPDSKSGQYILPIKKEAREKANLEEDTQSEFKITVSF